MKNLTFVTYLWLQYFDCNNIKYTKFSFNLTLLNYVSNRAVNPFHTTGLFLDPLKTENIEKDQWNKMG